MEIEYNATQFFIILSFILWLHFTMECIYNRKTEYAQILSYIQFGLMFPFILQIAIISLVYPLGYSIVFSVFIVSLYLVIVNITRNK